VTRIGPSRLRILALIIMDGHAKGMPPTIRELARTMGFAAHFNVQQHLVGLRAEGLVDWSIGPDGEILNRTLHPTCTFTPVSELPEDSNGFDCGNARQGEEAAHGNDDPDGHEGQALDRPLQPPPLPTGVPQAVRPAVPWHREDVNMSQTDWNREAYEAREDTDA